jgi:hypothetical protein
MLKSFCEAMTVILDHEHNMEQTHPSWILFLRGYPSPEWLSAIGSMLQVDPSLFPRHLEFQSSFGRRNCYFSPSLPSATDGIIRLRYITIGSRGLHQAGANQDEIDRLRGKRLEEMNQHLHALNTETGIRSGDSIERMYHVHDEGNFSIEQDVSIWTTNIGFGFRCKS